MPEVLIHSPYRDCASQGNSVTAERMKMVLSATGHRVLISQRDYSGQPADIMIALNARKSAKAIARFRYRHPQSKLVIVLTGTDINHPDVLDETTPTWISMKLVDRLVVLHEVSLQQVPKMFRDKTEVIYPSVKLPKDLKHLPEGEFKIIMAGNMRREKNPSMATAAAEKVSTGLRFHHYGEAEGLSGDNIIRHGSVPHREVLEAMARSQVLLNTSFQEGGANAICEAVCLGLPVVASAIPGNVGMLGEDYEGLFPSDDLCALIKILEKAAKNPEFYAQLQRQVFERALLFAYEREADAWAKLLNDLCN